MKKYASLLENGVYNVFEIVEEKAHEYVLNNGQQVLKNNIYLDIITSEEVQKSIGRKDVVLNF